MSADPASSAVRKRIDGYWCDLAQELPEDALREVVAALDRRSGEGPGALGGRSVVWRHTIPAFGEVAVKEYRRGGFLRYVTRRYYVRCGKTRPEREVENFSRARAAGVSVPEPVAAFSRGRILYRAWLVTRLIEGETLVEIAAVDGTERIPPLMDELSRQVRLLVDYGIAHRDLHPGNVLVDTRGVLHLLDFDKARTFHGPPEVLRDRYTSRWRRAVEKHGLRDSLWERFQAGAADGVNVARPVVPRRPLPEGASVLVVLMGSLGDVTRGLGLVSILKHARPDCPVTWLVDRRWEDLVARHPGIDRVLVFPRDRAVRAAPALARALRAGRFDVVLDLQRHLKSGVCSWLTGASRRIGFHPQNTRELNHLFNNEYVESCPSALPKLRHYLKFAEHVSLPLPEQIDFGLGWSSERSLLPPGVRALDGFSIAVVMGSSWPSKNWTPRRYRELLTRLADVAGCHALLLGDASQRSLADDVTAAAGSSRIVNLVGRTSVIELAAILRHARVAVGPDSGPGHLAAAVGTPYAGLFGPTDPRRAAPYRSEHLVVRSPTRCAPCWRHTCRRREGPCMDDISADMVWEKLEPLLNGEYSVPPVADARRNARVSTGTPEPGHRP